MAMKRLTEDSPPGSDFLAPYASRGRPPPWRASKTAVVRIRSAWYSTGVGATAEARLPSALCRRRVGSATVLVVDSPRRLTRMVRWAIDTWRQGPVECDGAYLSPPRVHKGSAVSSRPPLTGPGNSRCGCSSRMADALILTASASSCESDDERIRVRIRTSHRPGQIFRD